MQATDALANSGDVAPGHDRVKELVRPGRLQLGGLPAEAQQIVPIVLSAKVNVRVRIAYRSRFFAFGGQHHRQIGRQEGLWT